MEEFALYMMKISGGVVIGDFIFAKSYAYLRKVKRAKRFANYRKKYLPVNIKI